MSESPLNRKLHIARVESELGALTEEEALEMLRTGFLSPADLCRPEGVSVWKPLAELVLEVEGRPASALKLAKLKAAAAGGAAITQAVRFTRKLRGATVRGRERLTDSARGLLDSYTPQIQRLVANQLVQRSVTHVQAALHDDEFMRKVFGATYDCLPKPIHRFITEQVFIEFCVERRERLLGPPASESRDA